MAHSTDPNSGFDPTQIDADFVVLSLRALDGQLGAEEWARFQALIRESRECRMAHLMLCRQAVCLAELGQVAVANTVPQGELDLAALDQQVLGELFDLALQERQKQELEERTQLMLRQALEQERDRRLAAVKASPPPRPPRLIIIPRPLFYAALVLLSLSVLYGLFVLVPAKNPQVASPPDLAPTTPHEPEVLAVLQRQSADAMWGGVGDRPEVGDQLTARGLELVKGEAVIRFSTGVEVELVGPARFSLLDQGLTRLEVGEASVVVPESGQGFVMQVPGGQITDYGTAFQVEVPSVGLGQFNRVEVTQGMVVVESVDDGGAVQHAVQLRRNQVAELDQSEPGLRAYEVVEEVVTLDCPSTGSGIEPGSIDLNWSVIPPGGEGVYPAYVVSPVQVDPTGSFLAWLPGDIRTSQWVSPWPGSEPPTSHPEMEDLVSYGLQATVRLPDNVDPTSASLTLYVIYDDYIDAISVNGERVSGPFISPIPDIDERDSMQFQTWTRIDLPAVFKTGDNALRFDMRNHSSVSGLRVRMVLRAVQTSRPLGVTSSL